MEHIRAIVPNYLRDFIQRKANEKGIQFHQMAGHFIILGVDSDMRSDTKISKKCCNS